MNSKQSHHECHVAAYLQCTHLELSVRYLNTELATLWKRVMATCPLHAGIFHLISSLQSKEVRDGVIEVKNLCQLIEHLLHDWRRRR